MRKSIFFGLIAVLLIVGLIAGACAIYGINESDSVLGKLSFMALMSQIQAWVFNELDSLIPGF